mmetsp:Transcript_7186/g.16924  ORF Transcript_7186/g.16924 Transcript_7186/m.16924 type:complete len:209 (+) Transcript_7186:1039-1665(+)
MVLRRHVDLAALAVCVASIPDMLPSAVGPDKGDGLDVRVVADEVDCLVSAMDDIHNAWRESGLLYELHQPLRCAGHALRWLHDHGIAADSREREHPEGDHRWEVEGRDAGRDAEGNAVAVGIDLFPDILHRLSHEVACSTARKLDNLETAEDVSASVGQCLALLLGDEFSEVVHVLADQMLERKHHALPLRHRRGSPVLLSGFRHRNS